MGGTLHNGWEMMDRSNRHAPRADAPRADAPEEVIGEHTRRQCRRICVMGSCVALSFILVALRLSCVSTLGECVRGYPLLYMFFGHRNKCMPSFSVVPVIHRAQNGEDDGFWMSLNPKPDVHSAYLNVGKTKCFDEHIDAAHAFGLDCATYQCSPLSHLNEWTRLTTAFQTLHLDTVQFTRHWEWNAEVKYMVTEIVLLRWNGSVSCVDAFETQNGTACKCAEGPELKCEP